MSNHYQLFFNQKVKVIETTLSIWYPEYEFSFCNNVITYSFDLTAQNHTNIHKALFITFHTQTS